MKVLGYVMLHYGVDYLEYSLTPLCKVCDKVVILYSLYPTHNRQSGLTAIESRTELMDIAMSFDNVQWVDVYEAKNEGEHRGMIWQYTKGYDVLVCADYDEIWDEVDLISAIDQTYYSVYHSHGIDGFIHFWRSFNHVMAGHCIKDEDTDIISEGDEPDTFRPIRLWNLREKNTSKEPSIKATIYHFGYATKARKMNYKWAIHGHKPELKWDWLKMWNNWTDDNRNGQFHPVSKEIWLQIEDFDRSKLPEMMRKHPFYNKLKI